MKSSNVHAILGEVYRLLGAYIAADFIQASEYKGITPHLREALLALAREAERSLSDATGHPARGRHSRPHSDEIGVSHNERDDQISAIVSMIRRSPRFYSNPSILQFAKDAGLRVLGRPKESRERLAKRVAEAISLTPEPRRSQILTQLAGNGDTQTQGWIDVIKSRP